MEVTAQELKLDTHKKPRTSRAENLISEIEKPLDATPKKGSLEYERMRDKQKVKGIFHFYEVPGSLLEFNYYKYKGDRIEKYSLTDNEQYTIPLGVAKHLNQNGWYPLYEHIVGTSETGAASMRVKSKIRRFGFQSLEFLDIEDLPTHSHSVIEVVKEELIGY